MLLKEEIFDFLSLCFNHQKSLKKDGYDDDNNNNNSLSKYKWLIDWMNNQQT